VILRRVRRGWLRRAIELLRWSRALGYAAVAVAGLVAIINPPASVAAATGAGKIQPLVWAGLMAVSATFCAWATSSLPACMRVTASRQ